MTDDLVIKEGGLEVLHDRIGDLSDRPQLMTAAMMGDYISSGIGGSELAGQGRDAGDTIDEAVIALTRDLDDFSQSVNDSINKYAVTEDDAAVSFQQVRYDGPVMTTDDLPCMREEQQ